MRALPAGWALGVTILVIVGMLVFGAPAWAFFLAVLVYLLAPEQED